MSDYDSRLAAQRQYVVDYVRKCAEECRDQEKQPRRAQNKKNWEFYHGTIDWSHKGPDESAINLHKVGVAAERTRAKFKQALMNYDKWLVVEREYEPPNATLPTFAAKNLLLKQLERADAKTRLSDAILCGIMESRITMKVSGKYVTQPRYVSKAGKLVREERQVWQLDLPYLTFTQFLPDIYNIDEPLYQIEECKQDLYKVMELASEKPTPDKPFREEALERLPMWRTRDEDQEDNAAAGNPEKQERMDLRRQVLLQNFYGTVLGLDGRVYEWELEDGSKMPLKNVICVTANEAELLMDPTRNTRWSARAPFVYSDPLRSPFGGRKALMDAGTDINEAENELFSLMLDGALRSVHNATWYRESWVSDKRQLTGGVKVGSAIAINDSAPPNGEPIGVLKTGQVPQEAVVMHGMLDRAFAENVISNQIDLSGNLPSKQIRATEIQAAGAAISDVFDSMAADIEDVFIERLGEEAFLEIIQHIDEMDENEVLACFGPAQELGMQFLQKSPKERFDEVFGAFRFRGKGLKGIITNMGKAQALINLLNSLMSNPLTAQQIESQISVPKLVQEYIREMGVDVEKITPDERERGMIEQKQLIREQALAMAQNEGGQSGQANPGSASQGGMPNPEGMAAGNGMQGVQ